MTDGPPLRPTVRDSHLAHSYSETDDLGWAPAGDGKVVWAELPLAGAVN
jgi:hypothetical protein